MYVHKGGALCATPEKTETAVKESPSGLKALSKAAA